jgi:acetate kinase
MIDAVLVINAGSSSIKFALYRTTINKTSNTPNKPLLSGKIINIGQSPKLKAVDSNGLDLTKNDLDLFTDQTTHEDLIQWLLDWINCHDHGYTIKGVGHRIVHGGREFLKATRLTIDVVSKLKELIPLAPLHQPHNLAAIEAIFNWAPELPQVACFDTSFHHTQPKVAKLFGLPREYNEEGIIRYGFHGLSYQYIASCLPDYLGPLSEGRVIVAHLGNGASMCALNHRQSVASTMGFTALEGLIMGQRCGSIDAGVVIHLLRYYKMTTDEVEQMLYKKSGLLGVSGISNNMRVLQESDDPHAKEAIDLFCYRAARELASLVSTLNGLDVIVFTAGIGENSAQIREQICNQLSWLGVALDLTENQKDSTVINQVNSKVKVLVIPTNEEVVIAEATQQILASN